MSKDVVLSKMGTKTILRKEKFLEYIIRNVCFENFTQDLTRNIEKQNCETGLQKKGISEPLLLKSITIESWREA